MLTSPPEFFQRVQALRDQAVDFVLATVIRVRGSASAKAGSKAIFSLDGVNLYGYVGGGCAESHVAQEACEALKEKRPRIVEIDLDDEVFGLMPCGGVMDVYLEPHFSAPTLTIDHLGSWNLPASQFLKDLGFQCAISNERAREIDSWRQLFLYLAQVLAEFKGYALRPLRESKGSGLAALPKLSSIPTDVIVFGQTRISEEFCRLLPFMDWQARVYSPQSHADRYPGQVKVCDLPLDPNDLDIPPGAWVLIASHHRQDAAIARRALLAGAEYVALVASEKRARLIAEDLVDLQTASISLDHLFTPAGLNMPTDTPQQMAFSILCEILSCQELSMQQETDGTKQRSEQWTADAEI